MSSRTHTVLPPRAKLLFRPTDAPIEGWTSHEGTLEQDDRATLLVRLSTDESNVAALRRFGGSLRVSYAVAAPTPASAPPAIVTHDADASAWLKQVARERHDVRLIVAEIVIVSADREPHLRLEVDMHIRLAANHPALFRAPAPITHLDVLMKEGRAIVHAQPLRAVTRDTTMPRLALDGVTGPCRISPLDDKPCALDISSTWNRQ